MADNIEYLSMTQIESFEEELSSAFNPEADANAQIPPPPKGIYVVKLSFGEADADKRWIAKMTESANEKYYLTNVVAEIIENPANPIDCIGRKVFSNAMTLVMKNTGTTSAQAIIQAMGYGNELLTRPKVHQTQMRLINELLANGELCGMECDWEAQIYNKEKKTQEFRLRGMNSFPKDKAGNPIPMAITEEGVEVPARAFVRRWLTLEQLEELAAKGLAEEGNDNGGGVDDEHHSAAEPAPSAPVVSAPATRTAPATQAAQAAPAPRPPARRAVPTK